MARLSARTTQLFGLELHAFSRCLVSRLRLWMQGSEVRSGWRGPGLHACSPDGEAWPGAGEGGWCHIETQLPTRASKQNINRTLRYSRTYFIHFLYFPEMCDSPENIKLLEMELARVSLKKELGPDQENNVRDMKNFLENNNDAMAANFEEKHHCDLDEGMIIHHPDRMMTNSIERKPPEKVTFEDHHEVLRGIYYWF